MSTTALSPRMEEVRDLLKEGKSVEEVANELELSKSSVAQYQTKLRNEGHLPRKNGGPGRPAAVPQAASNGKPAEGQSIEDHVAAELQEIRSRIEEISVEAGALETEANGLSERETVLVAAQEALGK